ncbi:MAG: glycosyltransferase family 2 protein, partial [Mucilaginibacter sp.]|nr:glycosyltransferase family 2 protein [Mucilaginibacter sp.]
TYDNVEVIIIDDGSTDNTEQVSRAYAQMDKRINYYKYPNAGLGISRNRGLEKATGDYIQFLDADDLIEKRKFEIQLQIFNENPEVDIVYSSVRYFTNNAFEQSDRLLTYWGPNEEWMPKISGRGNDILARVFKGNFSHLSSPLFKKEIVNKAGTFDNEISAVADYHFLLRCAVANACFYYHDTADTYSLVRWHPDNMSRNVNMMRAEEQKMRIKMIPLLMDSPDALESNNNAIKSISFKLNASWKKHLLSGGKFDFIKKFIRLMGLEKLLLKVFYS